MIIAVVSTQSPGLRSEIVGWTHEDPGLLARGKPIGLTPTVQHPHHGTVLEYLAHGFRLLGPPMCITLAPEEWEWWLEREKAEAANADLGAVASRMQLERNEAEARVREMEAELARIYELRAHWHDAADEHRGRAEKAEARVRELEASDARFRDWLWALQKQAMIVIEVARDSGELTGRLSEEIAELERVTHDSPNRADAAQEGSEP